MKFFTGGRRLPKGPVYRLMMIAGLLCLSGAVYGQPLSQQTQTITLIAAGDNLIHDTVYRAAALPKGGYDFGPIYERVRPLIQAADIAFINQESILGGEKFVLSNYPAFNSPQEAGLALAEAGFDVVNHATNHTMDKGQGAVFASLDFWDALNKKRAEEPVLVLGVFRSKEQRSEAKIVERRGVKVGFLSYTYGLNGNPLPRDKPWLTALIDPRVMAAEIDALRPLCDLLVVSMHWGVEYRHETSPSQRELAALLAAHKVDLVLGHHPHVIEPVEILDREDGGKMVCFYSLGDFLSHTSSSKDCALGALGLVTVQKTALPGQPPVTQITGVQAIPTVCHYGRTRPLSFKVYPLYEYTEELAAAHRFRFTLAYLRGVAEKVLGVEIKQ
jgi:poly-gamma-glutamate synthesis protein (capsule biosynthesis protein)